MQNIFIGLGSNLEDRHYYLNEAIKNLVPLFDDFCLSSVYETAPCYALNQPNFLNQVLMGVVDSSSTMTPEILYQHMQDIEKKLGRTPSYRYGPRVIDVDLLFFHDIILSTPTLTIPHPRLYERRFVLEPLCEIEPDFLCPLTKKPLNYFLDHILYKNNTSIDDQ